MPLVLYCTVHKNEELQPHHATRVYISNSFAIIVYCCAMNQNALHTVGIKITVLLIVHNPIINLHYNPVQYCSILLSPFHLLARHQ